MANWLRWTSKLFQTARNHPPGGVLIPNEMFEEFRYWRDSIRSRNSDPFNARERMAEAARQGRPWRIGGGEPNTYVVANTALAVATTVKFPIQIIAGATQNAVWMGFDVSQDAALSATTAASKVDMRLTTAVNTGGAAGTVRAWNDITNRTAICTCRTNDTTTGAGGVILASFYVPVTSGLSFQFPLGREMVHGINSWRDLAITGATGVANNCLANVYIAE